VLEQNVEIAGAAKRNFEGEEDKNHSGPTQNHRRGQAYNMGTEVGGRSFLKVVDSKAGQHGGQTRTNDTRTGTRFKEDQKGRTERKMLHVGESLKLGRAILERAMDLFACFRDDKSKVIKLAGVEAACLIIACREYFAELKRTKLLEKSDEHRRLERAVFVQERLALKHIDSHAYWWARVLLPSKFEALALKVFLCVKATTDLAHITHPNPSKLSAVLPDIPIFIHLPRERSLRDKQIYVANLCRAYGLDTIPELRNERAAVLVVINKSGMCPRGRAHGDMIMFGHVARDLSSLLCSSTDPNAWLQKAFAYFKINKHAAFVLARWWWSLPLLPTKTTVISYDEIYSLEACAKNESNLLEKIVLELDKHRTGLAELSGLKSILARDNIVCIPDTLWSHFVHTVDHNVEEDMGSWRISYSEFFYYCRHRRTLDDIDSAIGGRVHPLSLCHLDHKLPGCEPTQCAHIALQALGHARAAREPLRAGWNKYEIRIGEFAANENTMREKALRAYETMHEQEYYNYLKKHHSIRAVVKKDWALAYIQFGKTMKSLLKELYVLCPHREGFIARLLSSVGLKKYVVWGIDPTLEGWRRQALCPSPFPRIFPAIDDMIKLLEDKAAGALSREDLMLMDCCRAFWNQKVTVSVPRDELAEHFSAIKRDVMSYRDNLVKKDDSETKIHRKVPPSSGFKMRKFYNDSHTFNL
jgi:hypothetical protein